MTNTAHTRPLSQVEIEQRILRVIDEIEERAEEFEDLANAAAEAEADYRRDAALTLLACIQRADHKMTVDERSATVDAAVTASHRKYLTTQAARNSCRESLLGLRGHLDALRTLNASVRAQT